MTDPLFEVDDLTIKYSVANGELTAVSDASFSISEGKYMGLVGESGCGKSTIAKSVMGGLDDNGEVASGKILYKGEEIQDYTQGELSEKIRWDEISLIPQSAMNSLDPVRQIDTQAVELAQVHTDMTKAEAKDQLADLFEIVGLQESRIEDYPHEFSGGMQQRAIIAFALLLEPSLIIADEPTTALDVIMQDQVFAYLDKIQDELGSSMMLITHDISVVLETCQQITVMHAGQVAESGSAIELYESPKHPYLIHLQDSFPDIRNPREELAEIEGQPPQMMGEADFCSFADRCPWEVEECTQQAPPLQPVEEGEDSHSVSCIRSDEPLYEEYKSSHETVEAVEEAE